MYRDPQTEPAADELDPSTVAVLAGRRSGPGGALNQGPVFASVFRDGGEHGYARDGNPTWSAFEEALGALEGGNAVAFGSGMAAAAAIVAGLPRGARVAIASTAYLEVRRLLADQARVGELELAEFDPLDTAAALRAAAGFDLIWLDTLTNPGLDVPELDRIGAATAAAETTLVVDSTLTTPALVRPLELGADLVLHSATKFIGGHSDLLLGAAVARDPQVASRLRERRSTFGAVPGTMEAWLALRGLRTLPLRIERGGASAAVLATRLAAHPAVAKVRYPGLAEDPAYATAERVLDGFGAVLSLELADADCAEAVLRRVRLITAAGSLGGVETLLDRQGRWHAGPEVPDGLLRLSVGCEHPDDLWRDLSSALAAA